HQRRLDAQPRPGCLPAGARLQPDAPDPGPRRALRGRRHRRADHPQPDGPSGEKAGRMTAIAERLPTTIAMRRVAWVGIAIGLVAAFVALPPIEARTPVPSIVLGLIAVTLGVGVIIRDERRMGGFAVAVRVLRGRVR